MESSTCETLGQKVNMRGFVAGNGLDVVVHGRVEAGILKVGLAVLGETVTVKGVLEMLQSQGILKNVGLYLVSFAIFCFQFNTTHHQ